MESNESCGDGEGQSLENALPSKIPSSGIPQGVFHTLIPKEPTQQRKRFQGRLSLGNRKAPFLLGMYCTQKHFIG